MDEDQFDTAHDAYQDVYDGDNHRAALRHALEAVSSDHLKRAEDLILQLPDTHDSRNCWLLEFGISEEADAIRKVAPLVRAYRQSKGWSE